MTIDRSCQIGGYRSSSTGESYGLARVSMALERPWSKCTAELAAYGR